VSSLEVDYDQVGWNADRTISSAAINSWIAQEVRIFGAEFTAQWRGALHVFRELDHRPGWYGALGYSFEGVLDIEAMHYDNLRRRFPCGHSFSWVKPSARVIGKA
jgi:hypothetical protein